MSYLRKEISNIISSGNINELNPELLSNFCSNKDGIFDEEECVLWDYKEQFPYGRTDDYCGCVVRLICAFHNTYGGLILFGIHDKTRKSGCNKVNINIEAFNNYLRTKLSKSIECKFKTIYNFDEYNGGKVDVLLVPQRDSKSSPVKFNINIGKYRNNILYFRQNHEVIQTQSKNIPFLFSRRSNPYLNTDDDKNILQIECNMPESPSTMKTFVGRTALLSELWDWLFNMRPSRKFLHGDGGSGKTTIAFEFAEIVQEWGGGIKTYYGNPIDQIIWLSAKRRELNVVTRDVKKTHKRVDFESANELYGAILTLANQFEGNLEDLSQEEIITQLEILFDKSCLFIIIDDIDTLTTSDKDSGAEILSELISRSRMGSKILYTLRNIPSLAISSAIGVPGLDSLNEKNNNGENNEYYEFIKTCCSQFNQVIPDKKLIYGKLLEISCGRPLILEVVIGLRKSCSSYEMAIDAYEGKSGDNPREYMFSREYNALKRKHSKTLLAALYCWGQPVEFNLLELSLRIPNNAILDSITEVSDMFLFKDEDNGGDNTKYLLNKVARNYIGTVCKSLEFYDVLDERIKTLKKGRLKELPILTKLINQSKKLIKDGNPEVAYSLLFDKSYSPAITERSDFCALRGYVAMNQKAPNLNTIREEMIKASDLGMVNFSIMKKWYFVELDSGELKSSVIDVCNRVIDGKGYLKSQRAEFLSRRGYVYNRLAKI